MFIPIDVHNALKKSILDEYKDDILKNAKIEISKKSEQLKESLLKEYNEKLEANRKQYKAELHKELDMEKSNLNEIIKEKDDVIVRLNNRNKELSNKEKELTQKELQLNQEKENMELRLTKLVNAKLVEEKKKIAKQKDDESKALIDQLKGLIETKNKEIKDMKKLQLELQTQKQELEAQTEQLQLDVQMKVNSQLNSKVEEAKGKLNLIIKERDLEIEKLQNNIQDLQDKVISSQNSGIKGDALEDTIEELLIKEFSNYDEFNVKVDKVAKGIPGADVQMSILTKNQKKCGSILFESKNCRNFNESSWVPKAADDCMKAKCDIVIIVSEVLPESIVNFGYMGSGVWVTNRICMKGLVQSIVYGILEIGKLRISNVAKDDKKEELFKYICSNDYKKKLAKVTTLADSMKKQLDTEKRTINRYWSERDNAIEKVKACANEIYADIKAIIMSSEVEIASYEEDSSSEANEC